MLKKLKLLKKPLFQKRRWSCDFPPRKMPVALKHRAISHQEKMAFSAPRRVVLGLTSPSHRVCGRTDVRMYGRTDGWSRDYYVTTKISRIDRLPTELNNTLRMFVTSLFFSTLVPELRSFRPAPRSQLLDCGKFVFETDNKVLNILFLMPI